LLRFLDWRGLFVFLALYGVLVIIAVSLYIVETLPPERRLAPGHSTARDRYRSVFSDRVFVGVALIGGMSFSGLFAYLSASSFLFQDVYGLNPQQYGYLFAINSLGIVLGVQVSSRLMRRYGPQWILGVTTAVQAVAALAIIVLAESGAGFIGVLIPLFFFITAAGFGFPAVQVLALVNHAREAGTAASVLGALNFGLAGLISPIVGWLGIDTAVPMGSVMFATSLVSIGALWLIVQPKRVPALVG
jgi:DHA1 family bicyclomycin/chloramphenicol resistance-like MFS transporter